jgi:hypothetical protein
MLTSLLLHLPQGWLEIRAMTLNIGEMCETRWKLNIKLIFQQKTFSPHQERLAISSSTTSAAGVRSLLTAGTNSSAN